MSVLMYWKGRLEGRCPIATPLFWQEGSTYRPNPNDPLDTWPRAVARYALYGDYLAWHRLYCTKFFGDWDVQDDYIVTHHLEPPKPIFQRGFFEIINPCLYVLGSRKAHIRRYLMPRQLHHDGTWNTGKVLKTFIQLQSWHTHCAAFEILTHMELTAIRENDPVDADLIDDIIRRKGYARCSGTLAVSG